MSWTIVILNQIVHVTISVALCWIFYRRGFRHGMEAPIRKIDFSYPIKPSSLWTPGYDDDSLNSSE